MSSGLDSYPPEFVSGIKSLAQEVGLWIGHQVKGNAHGADATMADIDRCRVALVAEGVLPPEVCHQIRDIAVAGAAVTLARAMQWEDAVEFKKDFDIACQPQPDGVSPELWRRTQDVFSALARMKCAEGKADTAGERQERRVFDRHVRHLAGLRKVSMTSLPDRTLSDQSYSDEAQRVIPANVVMVSTCLDGPSASSPRTPYSRVAEGRCTEMMCKALDEFGGRTWVELLWAMRRLGGVGRRKERQVPVLSCSRRMDMNTSFCVRHPETSGRFRALLIGIDYKGQEGLETSSGHQDVTKMRQYLLSQGYRSGDMKILADSEPELRLIAQSAGIRTWDQEAPTRAAIERGISWLVKDSGPGDSLFLHYSGHGSTFVGGDADEQEDRFAGAASGGDEALCPLDFRTAGMLFDDEVYRYLIAPLKEGVLLTCVIDCCQSGTILHLPYAFKAQSERFDSIDDQSDLPTEGAAMTPNADFDPGKMLQVIQTHPAMCAAAVFWAKELTSLDHARHDQQLGSMLSQVSRSAQAWTSK